MAGGLAWDVFQGLAEGCPGVSVGCRSGKVAHESPGVRGESLGSILGKLPDRIC